MSELIRVTYDGNPPCKRDLIPIDNENYVDFVEQFVKNIRSFSSQYGARCTKNLYNFTTIIGLPNYVPKFFDMQRTGWIYKPRWDDDRVVCRWEEAPSRSIDYIPQNNTDIVSEEHIDIEYYEAVYPIRVSIYEIYYPGTVIRIWALDPKNRWFLLWNGPTQISFTSQNTTERKKKRIFSPPLQPCNFRTKILRLEFNYEHSFDCCTKLDAVMLIGTSDLIFPKDQSHEQSFTNLLKSFNSRYPCHKDIHNLTPDYKNAQSDIIHLKKTLKKHCIMCESDVRYLKEGSNSMRRSSSDKLSKLMKDSKLSSDRSKKLSSYSLSKFPDEVIMKILRNLDLKSLCCVSRVDKRFNNLVKDPKLYTSVNLKPFWNFITSKEFNYLAPRFKYLRRLDLSNCLIFISHLTKFFDTCGNLLTHL